MTARTALMVPMALPALTALTALTGRQHLFLILSQPL
jgi:hypothetical protein